MNDGEELPAPMLPPEDQSHGNDGDYTRGNYQMPTGIDWTKPWRTS